MRSGLGRGEFWNKVGRAGTVKRSVWIQTGKHLLCL